MITFSPQTLKDSIINSIKKLDFLDGDISDITFNEFLNLDETDYEDFTIDENRTVHLYVGCDTDPAITVKQLISMAQEIDNLTINSAQNYAKSTHEAYFLLEISDYNTFELLNNTFNSQYDSDESSNQNIIYKPHYRYIPDEFPVSILEETVVLNGKTYYASLFKGFCIYHLLVEKSENFDKYNRSYSPDDFFIKIHCKDADIEQDVADALAEAYAFELQSSFDILLPFSKGRGNIASFEQDDTRTLNLNSNLFPLIYGSGTADVLRLYNTAKTTNDLDFKLLGFTKIIEYIAPTIAQKELLENISLKLTSPNIFKPTATFISELGSIYDKHRVTTTKDNELIKLSILKIITLTEIWEKAPAFIKGKQTDLPPESDHIRFLEKIAECIYSTRNKIAHAKANYENRGTECPIKYKEDFCMMLEFIAIRCIRWFSIQPDEKRVVLK